MVFEAHQGMAENLHAEFSGALSTLAMETGAEKRGGSRGWYWLMSAPPREDYVRLQIY